MNQVQQITEKIEKLRAKVRKIQDACEHNNHKEVDVWCSSCNYDPSNDGCMYTYQCQDCMYRWTRWEPQR